MSLFISTQYLTIVQYKKKKNKMEQNMYLCTEIFFKVIKVYFGSIGFVLSLFIMYKLFFI